MVRQHDNSFFGDPVLFQLTSAVHAPLLPEFAELGAYAASSGAEERARLSHRHKPLLHSYDNFGTRCDQLDLHPAYHSLLTRARHAGIASSLFYGNESRHIRHQARSIRLFLLAGVETGCLQQLCMSSLALEALHTRQDLLDLWKHLLSSPVHDPSNRPATQKQGTLLSWAIDEHQTGTTIGKNLPQTQAIRAAQGNKQEDSTNPTVHISGEKAAIINPFADGFLVNAAFEGENCLFLVPRLLDDGLVNGIRLYPVTHEDCHVSYPHAQMRFNASLGFMLGDMGEAPRFINKMQDGLQFDHAVMSIAVARRNLRLAIDLMRHESTNASFPQIPQKYALQKGGMQARLYADAALDCAAATLLVMRLAQALDLASQQQQEAHIAAFLVPICGFWVPRIAAQIIDCISMSTPFMQVTTGSLLDRSRRYLSRNRLLERTAIDMLAGCLDATKQPNNHIDKLIYDITANLGASGERMAQLLRLSINMTHEDASLSCFLVEQMAYTVAASCLQKLDMDVVTSAFINSRLGGQWRSTYGMLNPRFNPIFILETLYPSS